MATGALVLTTILVMLMLRPVEQAARAGDSVTPTANGIGVITITSGEGPDNRPNECIYLLDNRTESLMIYSVESAAGGRNMLLRTVENLPVLFRSARPR
ncbi:MAG: hypothetical protein EXS17_07210 [Phycisphaerales bacterium]|nr:hypothetical protein [Phycisphaerales bacterium]